MLRIKKLYSYPFIYFCWFAWNRTLFHLDKCGNAEILRGKRLVCCAWIPMRPATPSIAFAEYRQLPPAAAGRRPLPSS